jgi:histone H3/H4
MGKGSVIPKEKRGGRSKKLQLAIPLPALTKRINERKPRDKRMGTRAIVTTAGLIEYLCRLLMEDACARVKEGSSKTLNVKHIARSLSDPSTNFYNIFSARVACVFTTPETDVNEEEDAADAPAEAIDAVESD